MRLVWLARYFAKGMGYAENMLPKYLARTGIETHVVTTDLPPNYWLAECRETYGDFSGQPRAGSVESLDGYTLHILGHKSLAGHMRMVGLREKLSALRPDIVQAPVCIGWTALDAAICKARLGFKLFTENHYHASVFPLANKPSAWWNLERLHCATTRTFPGWLVSLLTEKCYAIAPDCSEVATRFFGLERKKVEISGLGVDTELFTPASSEKDRQARLELRQRLGFAESDIVCIYTGRFSEDKNPLLLAQAVADIAGKAGPYRGLFVGQGMQAAAIESCAGCATHPFMPVHELAKFYRAADIGVWPTQESMSMLDAAACGLPVVANDSMSVPERIDGNGMLYRLNDRADLVRVLLGLQDPQIRQGMGAFGAQKMARDFSWESVAKRRLQDYQNALRRDPPEEKAVPKELFGQPD